MFNRLCMGFVAKSDNPLASSVINRMIDNLHEKENEIKFCDYMQNNKLKSSLITKLLLKLNDEGFFHLMQVLVRTQDLNEYQQELLAEKKNILLLENYLAPDGFLEPSKRLSRKAEFVYLRDMIERNSMVGIELLKTYIDNFKRDVLTDELLEVAIKNYGVASRYLLLRSFLNESQEIYLVKNMPESSLADYLRGKQIYQDSAQLHLVEEHYELSKVHYNEYGLRSRAQQAFYAKRRVEIQHRHPLSAVP